MCSVKDRSRVTREGNLTPKKGATQRDGAKQGKRYVFTEADRGVM